MTKDMDVCELYAKTNTRTQLLLTLTKMQCTFFCMWLFTVFTASKHQKEAPITLIKKEKKNHTMQYFVLRKIFAHPCLVYFMSAE